MAISDSQLNLVAPGFPLSLVAAAGINIPSQLTIDVLGVGVGVAPPVIIGNRTLFGSDMGVGGRKIEIRGAIGTAVATADACTTNFAFQGAPDTGAAGGYQPGPWQTLTETGPLTAAQLTAGAPIRIDWPVAFPPDLEPRFYRLLAQVPAGLFNSAGTLAFAIVTMDWDDWNVKYGTSNYVTA